MIHDAQQSSAVNLILLWQTCDRVQPSYLEANRYRSPSSSGLRIY
ncbi:hypothetical protein [Allocoleopsis sp.]